MSKAQAAPFTPEELNQLGSLAGKIREKTLTPEDHKVLRSAGIAASPTWVGAIIGSHCIEHVRVGTGGDIVEGVLDGLGRLAAAALVVGGVLMGTGHLDVTLGKSS